MLGFLKKLLDHGEKELKKFKLIANEVFALEDKYSKMTDKGLQSCTKKLKKRLENGETLEELIPDAFAVVREAAYRVIGEKPFYTQVLGALSIHFGNISEMKTGEGKTLTCVMPAYLNALTGKGVHVVTVNEYLATRDAEWMGKIYAFLGMTVAVNLRDMSPKEKKEAYEADILY